MVVFDVVDTETSSLKLVTTTSVKLRNFPTAAESDFSTATPLHNPFHLLKLQISLGHHFL